MYVLAFLNSLLKSGTLFSKQKCYITEKSRQLLANKQNAVWVV